MMVHEDYQELLAAKALTALDAEDAQVVDAHLSTCAECRAELREWKETAAFLACDAGVHEPSAELRQQILLSVGAAGSQAGVGELNQNRASSLAEPAPPTAESRVLAFERPRRRGFAFGSMGTVGAIAAALAMVALLVSLIVLWQQNRRTQAEMAQLSTQIDEAKAQLAREREAVELLTSPGARMAKLAGTKDAPGAQAMLAYDTSGHAMLMAKGLPAAPQGMAYQLWFIKDGKKMPGKVFSTDASGNGMLEDDIPAVAREAAVFAVTLEPESGVQVPTGAIYLVSGA